MRRRAHLAALILATGAAFAVGCEDTTGPVPGSLQVSLETSGTEGAVLLTLTGEGVTEITLTDVSQQIYTREERPGVWKVAIFGTLAAGPIFTFRVPDVNSVDRYGAVLVEVADTENRLRGLPHAPDRAVSVGLPEQQ